MICMGEVDTRSLDRLHVGELLIVYHSLCSAEHVRDGPGLEGERFLRA